MSILEGGFDVVQEGALQQQRRELQSVSRSSDERGLDQYCEVPGRLHTSVVRPRAAGALKGPPSKLQCFLASSELVFCTAAILLARKLVRDPMA